MDGLSKHRHPTAAFFFLTTVAGALMLAPFPIMPEP
jgi:hypothetical protein